MVMGFRPMLRYKQDPPNGIDLMLISRLTNDRTLVLDDYGNDVYHAERILKAAGYLRVFLTRGWTKKLGTVKKFQSSVNIRVTGNIDPVTRDKLNELLDTLRTQNDPQYVKGMEILRMF